MTSKADNQIKAAWIGGLCVLAAALVTAIITLHPWSGKNLNKNKPVLNNYLVVGTIVDVKTNESISQAQVNIIGRTEQTTTEQNGNFRLILRDSLALIRLRISKHGYKPTDISSTVPNDNLIIQLTKVNE